MRHVREEYEFGMGRLLQPVRHLGQQVALLFHLLFLFQDFLVLFLFELVQPVLRTIRLNHENEERNGSKEDESQTPENDFLTVEYGKIVVYPPVQYFDTLLLRHHLLVFVINQMDILLVNDGGGQFRIPFERLFLQYL